MNTDRMIVRLEILSYWHAGTGRGGGAGLDAVVERDGDGLPYLPGRTLKGLLRHAAACLVGWGASGWSDEVIPTLFGSPAPSAAAPVVGGRHGTFPGCLTVDSARLPDPERQVLRGQTSLIAGLFATLPATAIDADTGAARDESLRFIEACVPLALVSEILWDGHAAKLGVDDGRRETIDRLGKEWQDRVRECLPLVRAIGAHRSRGFGRTRLSVEEAVR
jgi:hypothetical protein